MGEGEARVAGPMPIFDAKGRSWNSYLTGIGASGALVASGIVMFVIMVGVVTFKTWPHAGDLLGVGDHDVALNGTAAPAPQTGTPPSSLNVVKLLGGGAGPASRHQGGNHAGAGGNGGSVDPGENDGSAGGSTGLGGGQPQGAQQPSTPSTQQRGVVSQVVSGVGNTVQSDTDSLGGTVNNATGPNLGNVVSGLGSTLNKNLQALAGGQ
jgi:hypothetical protein